MNDDSRDEPGLCLLPPDRERLVRLCAHLTGRADLAEDLAQETLVEAWRQRQKLERPDGQASWLAAIARNICRRWRAQAAREPHPAGHITEEWNGGDCPDETAGPFDLEVMLERQELAELLDRALALLPALTRQTLLYQYLEDLPQAEIAARLGISEGAVAVRVHRGKLALRRVLNADACAGEWLALPGGARESWETTRLWCPLCGTRRLLGRMTGNPVVLALRCPGECDAPARMQTECPVPGGAQPGAYGRAESRVRTAVDRHYGLNRVEAVPPCFQCGRPTPLRVGLPDGLPPELQTPGVHVFLDCQACRTVAHSALAGTVLSIPQGQRFIRRHPRVRWLPVRELEIDGLPAFATRFESRDDASALEVLIRRQDFRVIGVQEA